MKIDRATLADQLHIAAAYARDPHADRCGIRGYGAWLLTDADGETRDAGTFGNLVTQVGDTYYGERAAALGGAPAVVTGMQLGTGTTTPSKTGGGASIGTLVTASLVALTGTPTSALEGSARRILYTAQWAAGVATDDDISEVALVNQSTGTQTVAPASATIARALLSPTVNKASGDTLTVTWAHELLGA